jgi:hypothetical protein
MNYYHLIRSYEAYTLLHLPIGFCMLMCKQGRRHLDSLYSWEYPTIFTKDQIYYAYMYGGDNGSNFPFLELQTHIQMIQQAWEYPGVKS